MISREVWTDEQDKILCEMWAAGIAAREIALKLGRTVKSVRWRAMYLGLEKRKTKRRWITDDLAGAPFQNVTLRQSSRPIRTGW